MGLVAGAQVGHAVFVFVLVAVAHGEGDRVAVLGLVVRYGFKGHADVRVGGQVVGGAAVGLQQPQFQVALVVVKLQLDQTHGRARGVAQRGEHAVVGPGWGVAVGGVAVGVIVPVAFLAFLAFVGSVVWVACMSRIVAVVVALPGRGGVGVGGAVGVRVADGVGLVNAQRGVLRLGEEALGLSVAVVDRFNHGQRRLAVLLQDDVAVAGLLGGDLAVEFVELGHGVGQIIDGHELHGLVGFFVAVGPAQDVQPVGDFRLFELVHVGVDV